MLDHAVGEYEAQLMREKLALRMKFYGSPSRPIPRKRPVTILVPTRDFVPAVASEPEIIPAEPAVEVAPEPATRQFPAWTYQPLTPAIIALLEHTYGMPRQDITGPSRFKGPVRLRQIGMWLIKNTTNRSYHYIGRAFGNRDHSTAVHAVKKVAIQREIDGSLRAETDTLKSIILAARIEA